MANEHNRLDGVLLEEEIFPEASKKMNKKHNTTSEFVEDTFYIITNHLGYGRQFPITNLSDRLVNVIRTINHKNLRTLDCLVPEETEFYRAAEHWQNEEVEEATFFLQASNIFAYVNPEYVKGKIVLSKSQFQRKMKEISEKILGTAHPSQIRIQRLNSNYSLVAEAYLKY